MLRFRKTCRAAGTSLALLATLSGVTGVDHLSAQIDPLSVTQLLAVPEEVDLEVADVAPYGPSIVTADQSTGRVTVYDLAGGVRFSIDAAGSVTVGSSMAVVFAGSAQLANPDRAELTVAFTAPSGNAYLRSLDETGALLLDELFLASGPPVDISLYAEEAGGSGFAVVEFGGFQADSVWAYSFADYRLALRVEGEVDNVGDEFPDQPLIVEQGDSLALGYSADLSPAGTIRPLPGAIRFGVVGADLLRDGILDAYSTVNAVVGGVDGTRIVFYDATGRIHVDTLVEGVVGSVNSFGFLGLLPPDGGFHALQYTFGGQGVSVELDLRTDTGRLLADQASASFFTLEGCYRGESYLLTTLPQIFAVDTLYDGRDGSPSIGVPAIIMYEGQPAAFQSAAGWCTANYADGPSLVYDQEDAERLLFTSPVDDTTVVAEVAYADEAYGFSYGGISLAVSDLDADGNPATTVYRIGDAASATRGAQPALDLAFAPNPAAGGFAVLAPETSAGAQLSVTVHALDGRTVAAHATVAPGQTLPTPRLPGVYVVRVTDAASGRAGVRRLVVE